MDSFATYMFMAKWKDLNMKLTQINCGVQKNHKGFGRVTFKSTLLFCKIANWTENRMSKTFIECLYF